MPPLGYQQPGLVLRRGGAQSEAQSRELQRHLRALGYLRRGIDGRFGPGTERAVMALQHDLLHNHGSGSDGAAPVAVADYRKGRITQVTGVVDQPMAACIAEMWDDDDFVKLPFADDPAAANQAAVQAIGALASDRAPIPFLLAVLRQESNFRHFNVPAAGDDDTCIVVGLDANVKEQEHIITSRGYGIGQYTLFHHPPSAAEVEEIMLDPVKNVAKAIDELREKFDHFVNGPTSGTQADDRLAEFGTGPLRLCRPDFGADKRMRDCRNCALGAGSLDIVAGQTPWHANTSQTYRSTRYYDYGALDFTGVPKRDELGCDWPYAVRRYNGSGVNSYNYQARVLKHLLAV